MDRIPHVDRTVNEPLTNVKYPDSLLYVDGKFNTEFLGGLVSILLDADAITKSHIENLDYVSNILDTLKRYNNPTEDESEMDFMFGGGFDENTIFNDFKILDRSVPSSLAEFGGGFVTEMIPENFDEDSSNSSQNSNELDVDTEQYGGLDVKNIFITEKNLKKA